MVMFATENNWTFSSLNTETELLSFRELWLKWYMVRISLELTTHTWYGQSSTFSHKQHIYLQVKLELLVLFFFFCPHHCGDRSPPTNVGGFNSNATWMYPHLSLSFTDWQMFCKKVPLKHVQQDKKLNNISTDSQSSSATDSHGHWEWMDIMDIHNEKEKY